MNAATAFVAFSLRRTSTIQRRMSNIERGGSRRNRLRCWTFDVRCWIFGPRLFLRMTDPTMPLSGRAALVTGAGIGIGRAIVEALSAAGAVVGVHCHRSRATAETVVTQLRQRGGQAMLLQADLSVPADAGRIVDEFVAFAGRLDILVNNAGSPVARSRLEDCPLDIWQQVLATNLTSTFLVTQRAIPHLRASGHGAIVNNLTLSIQTGGANGAGPYAIAKAGLEVMTRTLARELAPLVRANSIMPGVIETRHHEVYSTPERMEQYRKETPLARNGTAEEVAAAVLFLVSDAASFINGALLDINGGRFLR
jgi:3-oxoacyl-[acyl-carrier protein] reductase